MTNKKWDVHTDVALAAVHAPVEQIRPHTAHLSSGTEDLKHNLRKTKGMTNALTPAGN